MILLTGATGRVGRAAASALLNAGLSFRVLVRDPAKLTLTDSRIEVITGDLGEAQSVQRALEGIERALIVMGNHPDQAVIERQFATLAREAGVAHVVKISSMEASADASAVLPRNHYETEQHIAASGMDWTFLRPNFYMQNMLMYAESIKSTGSFALPLGAAVTAMVDTQDVGDVAAAVLSGDGHAGQIYELTGPDLMTFHDVARRLGGVIGQSVCYREQTPEEFRATLERFISSRWQLDAVCELFAEIAAGSLAYRTEAVSDLLGRPPTTIESFAQRFSAVFGRDHG
ncbi:MAG: SDR family oxidoreductase [Luminiphilus sp.]